MTNNINDFDDLDPALLERFEFSENVREEVIGLCEEILSDRLVSHPNEKESVIQIGILEALSAVIGDLLINWTTDPLNAAEETHAFLMDRIQIILETEVH